MKKLLLHILLSWTLVGIIATQVVPLSLYGFEKSELIEKEGESEKELEKDDFAKKILFCVDLSDNIAYEPLKFTLDKIAHIYYPSPLLAIPLEIASPPPDVAAA
jgi:hypothetical protein